MSETNSDLTVPLSVAVQFIQYAAFDLIQDDPHQWGARPCSTCSAVSKLIKRPFGCVLYAKLRRADAGTP